MENSKPKPAWQIDRELRLAAVPLDRRIHASNWYNSETVFPTGDDLMMMFWQATVPGSGAPEIPYVEMVESLANQGFDVTEAERLLPGCLRLVDEKKIDDLRACTAELLAAMQRAPKIADHPYGQYRHPRTWPEVTSATVATCVSSRSMGSPWIWSTGRAAWSVPRPAATVWSVRM